MFRTLDVIQNVFETEDMDIVWKLVVVKTTCLLHTTESGFTNILTSTLDKSNKL